MCFKQVLRGKNSKYFFIHKRFMHFFIIFIKDFFIPLSLEEGTFTRKSKEKPIFPLLFAH
jgi:hypothetical protein